MVNFLEINPVLYTPNIEATIKFYKDTLGFSLDWNEKDDSGETNVAQFKAGSVSFMITDGDFLGDEPAFSGTIYFYMTGVEEYYDKVKDKAAILWDLQDMYYGTKEFGIKDINGYTFAFAEKIDG
jgi:uncharacterized glyoxalase superfamily protein PhnB